MSAITVVLLSSTDVFAMMLNLLVIYTFAKIRSQLTYKDYLIVGMAISDFFQCLLGYPLEIYSSQHGYWKFNLASCKVCIIVIGNFCNVGVTYRVIENKVSLLCWNLRRRRNSEDKSADVNT